MVIQGLIRPPPEIRAVADRTALFVAKNGRSFETRILGSDKGKTAKFAFLHATSPFHAYYEERVREYEAGGDGDDGTGETSASEGKDEKDKRTDAGADDEEDKGRGKGQEPEEQKKNKPGDITTRSREKDTAAAAARKASVADPVARILLAQRAKISSAEAAKISSTGSADDSQEKKDPSSIEKDSAPEAPSAAAPSGPAPPPAPRFTTLTAPNHATPAQIEVIKLTAQSAAIAAGGGKTSTSSSSGGGSGGGGGSGSGSGGDGGFLKALTLREWTNPLFAFLQPTNASHAYFTSLVDIYTSILKPGLLEQRQQKQRQRDTENPVGDEGKSFLTVASAATTAGGGGHVSSAEDLDVVPVDLLEGEDAHDAALTLAAYRAEFARYRSELDVGKRGGVGSGSTFDGSPNVVGIDWHDFVVVETVSFDRNEIVDTAPPLPLRLTKEVGNKNAKKKLDVGGGDDASMPHSNDEHMTTASDEETEEIHVVPSYRPKVVRAAGTIDEAEAGQLVVDPISGKSVPVGDLSEHMRIQLLDPKWAEDRKKFLNKQKESNIVGGEALARNIAYFAKERGGLIGGSEQDLLGRADLMKDQPKMSTEGPRGMAAQVPEAPPAPLPQASLPTFDAPSSGAKHPSPTELTSPPAKKARLDVAGDGSTVGSSPPETAAAASAEHVEPAPALLNAPTELLPAEEFLSTLSDPKNAVITVKIPNDSSSSKWNCDGREISVTMDVRTATVKSIKQMCSRYLGGMPANKMQLRWSSVGFLKDRDSLAKLNIGPGATLDLVPKVRGGRK